ncbi:MAG: hypothetical protein FWH36_03735 [Lentimicrobiaceae bacterium]|nr:hypothetical protein [Lentimicrobiaceae bacterium]
MRKFEITIAILSVIALVLNLLYIPGGTILAFLTFGVYAIFYYICSVALFNDIPFSAALFRVALLRNGQLGYTKKNDPYAEISKWRKNISSFTGWGLSLVILGILFRFLSLAGWKIMLALGLCSLYIILIAAVIKYLKTHAQFYIRIAKRSAIIGGVGLFAFLLPSEYSSDIVENAGEGRKFPEVKGLYQYENTEFLPTLEHEINPQKNAIYCVTMLYAWEEVRKQINLPLTISPNYTDLLLLNNSQSFVNVLKKDEYFAEGGVVDSLIFAKAKFAKSLPFNIKLDNYDDKLKFKGETVASFGVTAYSDYRKLETVKIVYYKNDNNFIIKLLPRDKNHEILLFKTDKVFHSIAEMNEEIIKLSEIGKKERKNEKQRWKYYIAGEDEVIIPKFNFNIETDYAALEDNIFQTEKQDYRIVVAWQRTAFLLDESGAEIESEAEFEIAVEDEEEEESPQPKKMIFDKDFLILLQRTDAPNPYFGLWVTNTELMTKGE